jgi:pimeloyl-[acyl-carrier protein] methyl ester esterase
MNIQILGEGPDLVMLHGWAMHSGILSPLTRLLQQSFRLHLVDLPGHGYSVDEPACRPEKCAERIANATPPAIWVGWSLGGLIAMSAAISQQSHVRCLVEIAASPRFVVGDDWSCAVDPAVFKQFASGLRENYRRTIERFLALEALGSEHAQIELRELKAHVFDRGEPSTDALCDGLRDLDETDLRAQLPEIKMPSLWIAGRRDQLVPAAAMRFAAQACAGRYLEFSAGHAPFLGHAEAIAAAIRELTHAIAT